MAEQWSYERNEGWGVWALVRDDADVGSVEDEPTARRIVAALNHVDRLAEALVHIMPGLLAAYRRDLEGESS